MYLKGEYVMQGLKMLYVLFALCFFLFTGLDVASAAWTKKTYTFTLPDDISQAKEGCDDEETGECSHFIEVATINPKDNPVIIQLSAKSRWSKVKNALGENARENMSDNIVTIEENGMIKIYLRYASSDKFTGETSFNFLEGELDIILDKTAVITPVLFLLLKN